MSNWTFEDSEGSQLILSPAEYPGGGVFVRTQGAGSDMVQVKPEEAIGIAGNLITFSRAEATVVKGKLPEVTIEEIWKGQLHAVIRDDNGIVCQWEVRRENIENARRCAYDALAVANRIEEYLDSEEYAAKKLQERRDAIAQEQGGDVKSYRHLSPWGQKAVDRIIELENELKAAAQ